MMPLKQHSRQYDLVVLGATGNPPSGYTGQFVAEHVTTHLPINLKWAVAGRSESKLQAVIDECRRLNPDRSQPSIEIADVNDDGQLHALAEKAFVVITTVGPYYLYGERVFKACAESGTHYLDCTGETPWVARMINKYERVAQETGAIMFPQIGIESAPADLCTSAPSGGTLATALGIRDDYSLEELRAASQPYASSPIPHPEKARPSMGFLQRWLGICHVPNLGTLTTSIAGRTDAPTVERSWGLLSTIPSRKDQFYGPKFNWVEYYKPRNWLHGIFVHWGLILGMVLFGHFPSVRALVKRFVYQPGQGTSRENLAREEVEYRGIATPDTATPSGKQAYCRAWFHGSMYYLTAVFLAQGALTILEDDVGLDGGAYTPACLGQGLVDRANTAGFKMESVASHLESEKDINALARTNRRIHYLLDHDLYRRNARESGGSALQWAASRGRELTAQFAIAAGADVNAADPSGRTPLSLATRKDRGNIAKLILATGRVDRDSRDSRGRTPLFHAVRSRSPCTLKLLLARGFDPQGRDRDGWTPLLYAAKSGNNKGIVELLLASGRVNPDSKDSKGCGPVVLAARAGDEEVVKLLLPMMKYRDGHPAFGGVLRAAAVNGLDSVVKALLESDRVHVDARNAVGRTAFSRAAGSGQDSVVKLLLESGRADADSRDDGGLTVLGYAAKRGHATTVKLLLNSGKVTAEPRDLSGRTPLSYAAERGHHEVVETLLAAGGVDPNSTDNSNRTPLLWAVTKAHLRVVKLLLGHGGDVEAAGRGDWTPLTLAAHMDHPELVSLLLREGADANATATPGGRPALHLALNRRYSRTARLLLDGGADPNGCATRWSSLLQVSRYGNADAVRLLLDHGARTTATDARGQTCLIKASVWAETTQLLLDNGADIEARDDRGCTALLDASNHGRVHVVALLLEHGANAAANDNYGLTPLHRASRSGYCAVVGRLLETPGVVVGAEDSNGRTALFHAAMKGNAAVVQLLLRHTSADKSKDRYGATAVFAAARNGHHMVVDLLLDSGGASLDHKDGLGRNLLFWATRSGKSTVVDVVLDYARKTSTQIQQDEFTNSGSRQAAFWFDRYGPWCTVCTRTIPHGMECRACSVCDGGHFHICAECKEDGAQCRDESHRLEVHYCRCQEV
ncbi:Ankyrin repeat domain-containing protein 50 [Tolypocladium capitatum]|uniref:Ankyrin repeat domain-containing protein 50 n=1 Tax=Tolypocladium capitatum TaxID=45235 RepID=A0A2K3QQV5_9HYPO|nr:Ankyrin repeat domain-containing protein 50 [Tolypocladium capitatum]